jgi:hypothetical protein
MTRNIVRHTNADLSLHMAHTAHLFNLFQNKFMFNKLNKLEIMNAILLHDFGSGMTKEGVKIPVDKLFDDNHSDEYSHSRDAASVADIANFTDAVKEAAYHHHMDA